MKKHFLGLTIPALLAASISVASSASAQQKLIPTESEISFTSRQMGVPVSGSFKKFGAQIVFDPKKPVEGAFGCVACHKVEGAKP